MAKHTKMRLGRIARKVLELVQTNEGMTYKNLAFQIYGKITASNVSGIRSVCVSLRKKGFPTYLLEDGGGVAFVTTKKEWKQVSDRSSEIVERYVGGYCRTIVQLLEKQPDLIPEAKLHLNELASKLMNLENESYRQSLLAAMPVNQNDSKINTDK